MKMGKAFAVAVGMVLMVSASGCFGGPVYTFGKNCSDESGTTTEQFSVSSSGDLTVALGGNCGDGSVSITIKNPSGDAQYSKTISSTGQIGGTSTMKGMSGEWTVVISLDSFTGQIALTITQ